MYAGMNSWCPDEPPTLVSQTRQEEEEEKGSLKETYSSYIYKILKQIYSDTGISNKARRRRERKSKRRYISLTCTNLTLVSQTRQEEEGKESLKETYSSYIYKVLKQIYSDTGISNKARRRRERKSKRSPTLLTSTRSSNLYTIIH
jgi:hypothetical protein